MLQTFRTFQLLRMCDWCPREKRQQPAFYGCCPPDSEVVESLQPEGIEVRIQNRFMVVSATSADAWPGTARKPCRSNGDFLVCSFPTK